MSASASEFPVTLRGQLERQRPRYVLGALLLCLYQGAQYWFDQKLRVGTDAALAGRREEALLVGLSLAAVALASFFVRVLSRVVIFNAGRTAEYELRSALLHRLQRLGSNFYQRVSAGDIMSRVTNDLTQVRLLLGFGALNSVNTALGVVSALLVTLPISPKLTFAALAPLPLLLLVTRHFSAQLYTKQKDNQDALGKMSDLVQSSISGSRVVRSFHLEPSQEARFVETNEAYLEKSLALARLRGSLGPIMGAITSAGTLIVFWYGGLLLVRGEITPGALLVFFRALGRLTWPLMALGFLIGLLQRGRAAYSRLEEVFRAEPEIVDGPRPAPERVDGALRVSGLSYSYGDRAALSDVSFEVPAGTSLAIVGRTGSGKSTLARLLPRLEKTPPGTVFLDGVDITELPLATVRGSIGYAQQTPFLFSTTARRNVGLALDEVESEPSLLTIQEAARKSFVLSELLALPEGLDTVVGERGVQLSGGQKQRVALAAAFVLGPKLLVLDDPLSAVDAKTERGILDAVDEQRAERGVILITHRVAAARHCDRIIVLDQGRVVESGTHDELCRLGGIYATFAEEQRIESELQRLGEEEEEAAEVVS